MNKLRELMSNNAILTILFGILMIFMPDSLLVTMIRIFGALVIVYGAYCLFQFVKSTGSKKVMNIILAIVAILVGIKMMANPASVATFVPQLMGAYLLISGCMKLAVPVAAVPDILMGIVLLTSAFGLVTFAIRIVGIVVLAIGLADLKIGQNK